MTFRFPGASTRVSPRRLHRYFLLLIVGWMGLAPTGCFHAGTKPISNPPTQQQLQAYAEQQTALRNEASNPKEDDQQHCDQLATTTPGVEELRINQGAVESRQWTLLANGSTHRWVFVRAPDASAGGW